MAAVALIDGAFILGESQDISTPSLDVPSVMLSAVGLFILVCTISIGGEAALLTDAHHVLSERLICAADGLHLAEIIETHRKTPAFRHGDIRWDLFFF